MRSSLARHCLASEYNRVPGGKAWLIDYARVRQLYDAAVEKSAEPARSPSRIGLLRPGDLDPEEMTRLIDSARNLSITQCS